MWYMETVYISYSRVSTNEQGEKGVSIEAQIEEHERWAAENKVKISYYFQDAGYSAGTFKRPGLQEMIALISKNIKKKGIYPFRYVLLLRYQSRLIRDISKKRSLQCVFDKYNVTVHCLNGDWKKEPNAGGIVSDIQMLIDENERLQVSGRVYDSYRHIALSGCYPIGGSKPPVGFRRQKCGKNWKLIHDEKEATEVKELFELLATGEYTGKKVCAYLNGINYLNRKWSWNSLAKLIDNPIYYGRFRTSWFDSDDPSITEDQKQGWYSLTCHVEPIVSRELFDDVQDKMHRKKKTQSNHVYYFKGKVRCHNCGSKMNIRCAWRATTKEPVLYKYYYCPKCEKRINESYILENFLYRYPNWERKLKDLAFCEQVKKQISQKKEEMDLVTELFEDQTFSVAEYTTRYKKIAQDMSELTKELSKIAAKKELDWSDLSEREKTDVIQNSIDMITVIPGPIEDGAAVLKIDFYKELPKIRKAKVRK